MRRIPMWMDTGAFGAHGLKSRVDDLKLLKTWDTAAHYQLVHSFVRRRRPLLHASYRCCCRCIEQLTTLRNTMQLFLIIPLAPRPSLSGWLLLAGVVLFSGSLYALVLSRIKVLGAITPIGGLLMIAAWLSLLL